MVDYVATGAETTNQPRSHGGAGDVQTAYAIRTGITASSLLANDRILVARLPKGAVIVGGRLFGANADSTGSGSALLDVDVGVDMGGTVDTDQLGNFGVLSAAAVTGVKPEVSYEYPLGGLLRTAGPQTMTGDYNNVYITCVASAAGNDSNSGSLGVEIRYRISRHY
jgi:hypothetical protein